MLVVDLMKLVSSLYIVECEELRISAELRAKLNAACIKNRILMEDSKKLTKMYDAGKKMADYDAKGIGYYRD